MLDNGSRVGDKALQPLDLTREGPPASLGDQLKNETTGKDCVLVCDFTERQKDILLAGGLLNLCCGQREIKLRRPCAFAEF